MAPGGEGHLARRYLKVRGIRGTWRLKACVPRQAVSKRIFPGGSRAVQDDNAEACDLGALDVHGLQGFGDTLKAGLLNVP